MVQYVVDSVGGVDPHRVVVVVGDGADLVAKKLSETAADPRLVISELRGGRGSADSALVGLDVFADDFGEDDMVIVPGNLPLLTPDTVTALVAHHQASGAAATVLAVPPVAGDGLGRLVQGRDVGSVDRVLSPLALSPLADVEEPWLAASGVFCVRRSLLAPSIRRVRPDRRSGEFELSEFVGVLTSAGHQVAAFELTDAHEVQPVTDRVLLASAERGIRRRTNTAWMQHGVTMIDPDQTYIDTTVRLAADVTLFPGTMLQGSTVVGPGAEVGPDTRLADCAVGRLARVEKTMGREAEVGEGAHVGPFAVLEPGSQIAPGTITGPFHHATAND